MNVVRFKDSITIQTILIFPSLRRNETLCGLMLCGLICDLPERFGKKRPMNR